MSDPKDKTRSTPRTSSPGGASSTKALSVKVDSEPAEKPKQAPVVEKTTAQGQIAPKVKNETAPAETAQGAGHAETERSAEAVAAELAAVPAKELSASLPHALETASRDRKKEVNTMDAINDTAKAAEKVSKASRESAANPFDQFSKTFKAAFGDAGSDAARITSALVEFAQESARNNFQFAQDYVGARSVPEMVNVQTAYLKRQMELVNRQTTEFRQLALEITSKKTAQLQGRVLGR